MNLMLLHVQATSSAREVLSLKYVGDEYYDVKKVDESDFIW